MASILQRCFTLLAYLTIIQVCLANSNSAKLVKLDLYYESLCPFSANFIANELPIIFVNGLIDIVDLRLFPWGNAMITSDNSFDCQHGPDECLLNTVQACAIDARPNLDDHFPFIACIESQVYEGNYTQWETCLKEYDMDPKTVNSCYKGALGKKLELKYANITDRLKPPHQFVPWVVVDGKPLLENYLKFTSYICKAYKGTPPSACKNASIARTRRENTNHVQSVCYKEKIVKASVLGKI